MHNNQKISKSKLKPGPKTRYLQSKDLSDDLSQQEALCALENIYLQFNQTNARNPYIKGVYLWGEVGRGKTCLMDLFYQSIDSDKILRLHFHHFMASIHTQLKELSGHTDPLKLIAKNISKQYQILCFDEFFVSDIGDAMLLGRLLQYLFKFRVTLIATSNIAAEDLYKDGLQRIRFTPAIKAILEHTHSIHLSGTKDHRERNLHVEMIYFLHQKKKNTNTYLLNRFKLKSASNKPIFETILGRNIPCIARNHQTICFEFSSLCEGPRSHLDYIEIANRYQTILLFNIPPLSGKSYEQIKARGTEDGSIGSGSVGEREVVLANKDDATRRLIALVDEFYDQKVTLFLSSSTPLKELYTEGSLIFEFQRTHSRLIEMASSEYQKMAKRLNKFELPVQ